MFNVFLVFFLSTTGVLLRVSGGYVLRCGLRVGCLCGITYDAVRKCALLQKQEVGHVEFTVHMPQTNTAQERSFYPQEIIYIYFYSYVWKVCSVLATAGIFGGSSSFFLQTTCFQPLPVNMRFFLGLPSIHDQSKRLEIQSKQQERCSGLTISFL